MTLLLPATRLGQSPTASSSGRAVWDEQADAEGLVRQTPQAVVGNLVALEMLQAPGISLTVAPAKAFQWRLEAGEKTATYKNALLELRYLFLAQFLNLIEHVPYPLGGSGLLSRVLHRDLNAPTLLLWVPRTPGELGERVVAGSVAPAYPIFSATWMQLTDGRQRFARWLVQSAAGQLIESGENLRLADSAVSASLRDALNKLKNDPATIDASLPWHQAIERVAATL